MNGWTHATYNEQAHGSSFYYTTEQALALSRIGMPSWETEAYQDIRYPMNQQTQRYLELMSETHAHKKNSGI